MLRLIPYSLKTPLLQRAFSPARNVGAVTPNRSQSSHSLMAVALMSVGMMMLPLPSVVMMLRFMAMLWLWGYTSERCVQLVAEHRQVIVKFLRGYL